MSVITIFRYALSAFFILIAMFAIIKSRYKKFTRKDFVLRFRSGKLMSKGYGGAYFVLPLIDELIVLNAGVNNLEIDTRQLITLENLGVRINGLVNWNIEDPVKAYQSFSHNQHDDIITHINKMLDKKFRSIIRSDVIELTLNQILRETSYITESLTAGLESAVNHLGVKVNSVDINYIDVVDNGLGNQEIDELNSIRSIVRKQLDMQNNLETKTEGRKL